MPGPAAGSARAGQISERRPLAGAAAKVGGRDFDLWLVGHRVSLKESWILPLWGRCPEGRMRGISPPQPLPKGGCFIPSLFQGAERGCDLAHGLLRGRRREVLGEALQHAARLIDRDLLGGCRGGRSWALDHFAAATADHQSEIGARLALPPRHRSRCHRAQREAGGARFELERQHPMPMRLVR